MCVIYLYYTFFQAFLAQRVSILFFSKKGILRIMVDF